jgi:KamA family protein
MKDNAVTLDDLKKHLCLSKADELKLKEVINTHPLSITKYYFSLINWEDKKDPIKKMIVPSLEELNTIGSYDTSGESTNTKFEGLQHKYLQTVLVLSTNNCAAFCRFCFRKRLVGLSNNEILKNFDNVIKYIKSNKKITNVLISGGDPLTLSTEIIAQFLKKLSVIKHLRYIRIGSRIPVVLP